jgi:hypothetical protein
MERILIRSKWVLQNVGHLSTIDPTNPSNVNFDVSSKTITEILTHWLIGQLRSTCTQRLRSCTRAYNNYPKNVVWLKPVTDTLRATHKIIFHIYYL